jgi:hypothetical protein
VDCRWRPPRRQELDSAAGGFGNRMLSPFGEALIKQLVTI